MKRKPLTHAARLLCALALSMSLAPAALAADSSEPTQPSPCYPTAVTRSEDGTEIRKMYDLGPEDDPGGIPRSDFEQDGYHYTLTDLLKQELPANESRQHTETVSVNSKSKDMEEIMPLLAATCEAVTEDGYTGLLTLDTASIQVEASGYATSTRNVSATRSYPNLSEADVSLVPKSIEDSGRTLTLADVQWQEAGGFYNAAATYTGTASS
ncbi:cell wall anchor protein, partial [Bacteroides thetaiotaomicron]